MAQAMSQDPWQTRVDTHREFLEHNLGVNDELLHNLMKKRLKSGALLLTQTDKNNVKSNAPTNSTKVNALVEILRYKGPKEETFELLCDSLYEIKRVWIVQELRGLERSHSDESHDPWQTRVDTNREFLEHNLYVDDRLLFCLMRTRFESGGFLLTRTDKDNIESNAPTNSKKVSALVEILRFKGPKEETFELLCDSLNKIKRGWIVQQLIHSDESAWKQRSLEGRSTLTEPEVKGWKKRLTTAYNKAVPLLGDLLGDGDVQVKLVAAGCLTHDERDLISRVIKADGVKEAAAQIFKIIQQNHCFTSFCKVLLELNKPGRDLYLCLNPSQEATLCLRDLRLSERSKQIPDCSKAVLRVTRKSYGEVTEQIIIPQTKMYSRYTMAIPPHEEVLVEFDYNVKETSYSKGLDDYCPQTLLSRAGENPEDLKRYNILLFGFTGASKSSFLNTSLTMLQDESKQALSQIAVTRDGADSATQKITCYNVKEVHRHAHFNLWDTWGLDKNNYDPYQVSLLMKGKLPSGWKMHFDLDHYTARFDQLLKRETLFTEIHAVLFFVPQHILNDSGGEEMTKILQVFEHLRKEECIPLVILGKVDEVVHEVREEPFHSFEEIEKMRHTAAKLFRIDLRRVLYTVNYCNETSRNEKIEALARRNLTAALEMCELFLENRLRRFGRVSKRVLPDYS